MLSWNPDFESYVTGANVWNFHGINGPSPGPTVSGGGQMGGVQAQLGTGGMQGMGMGDGEEGGPGGGGEGLVGNRNVGEGGGLGDKITWGAWRRGR